MGLLDDLKHKAEELGDKAKEGFGTAKDRAGDLLDDAKDKAGDLVGDVKDRLGQDDGEATSPATTLTESEDIAPVGDVGTADPAPAAAGAPEPAETPGPDGSGLVGDLDPDASDLDVAEPDPAAVTDLEPTPEPTTEPAGDAAEPVLESGVDPYDEPLTETIGDEIAFDAVDREALAQAVGDAPDDSAVGDQDPQT